MSRLLDKIRIGAYLFRREYRKSIGKTASGVELDGLFIPDQQLILIRSGMTSDRERVVRLHENCHGALWDSELDLPDDLEERIVVAISERLAAIYPNYAF